MSKKNIILISLISLLFFSCLLNLKANENKEILTNQAVINMVNAGLSTSVIIAKIQGSDTNFDLSTDGLIALKKASVQDDIIKAMQDKQSQSEEKTEDSKKAESSAPAQTATPETVGKSSEPNQKQAAMDIKATSGSNKVQKFDRAKYLRQVQGRDKPIDINGEFVLDPNDKTIKFLGEGYTKFSIPYSSVTKLLYERTSRPRYGVGILIAWPLLFTKSKSHYLTIHYKESDKESAFVLIRLDKRNVIMALAAIEAETGITVERTEER